MVKKPRFDLPKNFDFFLDKTNYGARIVLEVTKIYCFQLVTW